MKIRREFLHKRKKKWSLVPDGGLIPGQIGGLTIGLKTALTLTVN
jgi:hypothetical protein